MSTRSHVNKLKHALAGMQSPAEPAPAKPDTMAIVRETQSLPRSRRGKRIVSAYVDPAVSQQLRFLAVAENSSVQALVEEA